VLAYETVDGLSLCAVAIPTAGSVVDQPTCPAVSLVLRSLAFQHIT
jgi:hypothetical protein